jgi:hypothetical protein
LVPRPLRRLIRSKLLDMTVNIGVLNVRQQIDHRFIARIANLVRQILGPMQISRQHFAANGLTEVFRFFLERPAQCFALLGGEGLRHLILLLCQVFAL